MKKILALISLVAFSPVHAEELFFGDVNYFLKAKQVNVTAGMDMSSYRYRYGKSGSDNEKEGYTFQASAAYAFTDQFNLFFTAQDNYRMKVTTSSGSYYQNGMQNPVIGGNYRLLNQNSSLVNLDFGLVAGLNFQDQELGSVNKDGNAANGRSSLELNYRIGKKWNVANEWQLTGGFVYNKSGEYKQLGTTTEKVDMDASTDSYLKLAYQYRPVHEIMFNISAKATQISGFDSKNKSTGYKSSSETRTNYDFLGSAKYLITDNFILSASYGQSYMPDYKANTSSNVGKVYRQRYSQMGIGLDFLF
ncbi:MAG: hypothetical protein AB7I27_14995 [Bacteriovoracaceae bacterium]